MRSGAISAAKLAFPCPSEKYSAAFPRILNAVGSAAVLENSGMYRISNRENAKPGKF